MSARIRAKKTHAADIFTLPLIAEFPTLGQGLRRYLQHVTPSKKGAEQERRRIEIWLRHPLADRPMDALQGRHFSIYRDARLDDGVTGDTVRLELAVISSLYTHAITDWGYESLQNPIMKMRRPKPGRGRRRRLQEGEEVRLLEACEKLDRRLKPLVLLLIETAMRRSELCTLMWRNVFFAKRYALLVDTKNGEERAVPLSLRALSLLREMESDAGDVFVSELSADRLSHLFIKARKLAGLHDLRLHDLRHEATSRLFEKGTLNMMEIASVTGHKSLQMLKRYTHLSAMHVASKLD